MTGYISIVKDDIYTFFTGSDEGSRLYIGDSLVVDNDGLHTYRERAGAIALAAGRHAITVAYFEQLGAQALTVGYSGGGIAQRAIPPRALYRVTAEKAIELLTPNGGESYGFGDTMRIAWRFVNGIGLAAVLSLSLDGGMTFSVPLFTQAYVHDAVQGDTFWVVPTDSALITNQARVKVFMYNNEPVHDVSEGTFSITALNSVRRQLARFAAPRSSIRIGSVSARIPWTDEWAACTIAVYSVNGALIHAGAASAGARLKLPPGAYTVSISRAGGKPLFNDIIGIAR